MFKFLIPNRNYILILLLIISPTFDSWQDEEETQFEDNSPSGHIQTVTSDGVCTLDKACQALQIVSLLTRRILSLEQPLWKISSHNFRWPSCSNLKEGGPCNCTAQSLHVNCWRLSLHELPATQTIPFDTAFLDLSSNKIQAIHRHSFLRLSRLVQLDVSNNLLDYLPENLFESLESLKYLHLHQNNLDSLPSGIFRNLKNLEILDLSQNRLVSLPPSIWSPSPGIKSTLRVLQISQNFLKTWKDFSALRNLEELDLSGNFFQSVTPLQPLKKLKSLKLQDNQLTVINETTFHGLSSLEIMSLRQNRIEILPPEIFKDLRNLENLDLSGNQITHINSSTFTGLSSAMLELNMAKNSLSILENETFSKLNNLARLSLHGNNLEVLEPGAFTGLTNLTWLQLGNNILTSVDPALFLPTQNLKRLELNNNDLAFVGDEAFEHLHDLEIIKLEGNGWNCDCKILYVANWVRDHASIVSSYSDDDAMKCRDPKEMEGRPLREISFSDVCLE
ncbi:carboxypeptidase N subunit 2 [Folsomia candida]|uniref:carboxypeptidase N subunit 2 n=1 Tax=Folsomia candida TaxID=158441 RepID=UPI000B8F2DC2|nr:carboxypeptidase N subunit 2 [Folsomia candida]